MKQPCRRSYPVPREKEVGDSLDQHGEAALPERQLRAVLESNPPTAAGLELFVEDLDDDARQLAQAQVSPALGHRPRTCRLGFKLERLLARVKKIETVSKAQLVLLADAIRRGGEAGDVLAQGDPRADANERLRDASGIGR